MIINNTQANIFKVNGGLADIFANRPAASGSFYVFYSIDTQEIFYDSGTWVLIGTGNLPTPTNIYNSDGTLTGNRTLNGGNNDLNFVDLNVFKTSVGGNDIGLKFDFANENYYFGDFDGISNGLGIFIANSNANKYINIGNQMAITLDCNNLIAKIGDIFNSTNKTFFSVDDQTQIIKTSNQSNDIGLKLDFGNQDYIFGDINKAFINIQNFSSINAISLISSATTYITQQPGLPTIIRNDIISLTAFSGVNNVIFRIDAQSRFAAFSYQNQSQGIDLAFQNKIYSIGQLTGGNTTNLTIDDVATYPIQINGTNILSGTSGGSSGQHLKIKLNGVDYKIKLENP